MIEHVYRRVSQAEGLDRVVVLTDDRRVGAAVESFGGAWEMTPCDLRSGTDRIAYAARDWDAAAVVNVQGDEPLIDPDVVSTVSSHLRTHPEDQMVTLATEASAEILDDPDVVKVVVDLRGRALYFSRAGVPFRRASHGAPTLKHLGIYGYRRATLLALAELEPTPLECSESLEQLRALENGIGIRVLQVDHDAIGVDTQWDFERVAELVGTLEGKGS